MLLLRVCKAINWLRATTKGMYCHIYMDIKYWSLVVFFFGGPAFVYRVMRCMHESHTANSYFDQKFQNWILEFRWPIVIDSDFDSQRVVLSVIGCWYAAGLPVCTGGQLSTNIWCGYRATGAFPTEKTEYIGRQWNFSITLYDRRWSIFAYTEKNTNSSYSFIE